MLSKPLNRAAIQWGASLRPSAFTTWSSRVSVSHVTLGLRTAAVAAASGPVCGPGSGPAGDWSRVTPFMPESGGESRITFKPAPEDYVELASRVIPLVRAHQTRGHLYAKVDPLELPEKPPFISLARNILLKTAPLSSLDYTSFGFSEADLKKTVNITIPHMTGFLGTWSLSPEDRLGADEGVFGALYPANETGDKVHTVQSLIKRLKEAYCGSIGVEYMHIHDVGKCNFIRQFVETPEAYKYTDEMRRRILNRTAKACLFEKFIGENFATVKRFGLDGCETLVVGLKELTKLSALMGIESIVMGMPHRGRLNVLTNVMQKPFDRVMSEFQGVTGFGGHDWGNVGDVKYHLGVEFEYTDRTIGKRMLVSVLPNPSHLEAVDSVVIGHSKARQYFRKDEKGKKVLPVVIHGDAAFACQGVVYETMQMSDVPGFAVGGAIHIVANNRIGFTTDVVDAGSSIYCTDLAKTIGAPIFHVNADDPEAISFVFELALKYRQKFGASVVIDVVGYRRFGHNELDMPKFTQPVMYDKIARHPNVLDIYSKKLLAEKIVTAQEFDEMKKRINSFYQDQLKKSKSFKPNRSIRPYAPQWKDIATPETVCVPQLTGVKVETLKDLGGEITTVPQDMALHPTVEKVYKNRAECLHTGQGVDFGFAESLAFATMLEEGYKIRMTGQDTQRGTFSHRHAFVHDQKNGSVYFPLNELSLRRGFKNNIEIHNSPLTEYAGLGFEYGYSLEHPDTLSIWEAQFGDFCNGAQIIIDQFIASGEAKWNTQSGIVLLLPHGYDGQGSEHSSGRMERFLQLADDRQDVIHRHFWNVANRSVIQKHNIQICNCTTPANYFHLLRRQMLRKFRKPLIVFTPKKLLRLRDSLSPLSEFVEGTRFSRYIFDPLFAEPKFDSRNSSFLPFQDLELDRSEVGIGNSQGRVGPNGGTRVKSRDKVKRLIVCNGQVYYDLVNKRKTLGLDDSIMISRIEQLSPFPFDQFVNDLRTVPNVRDIVWCQEEPMNQGAWTYVSSRFATCVAGMKHPIQQAVYAGRDVSASPAVGSPSIHAVEQDRLLNDALDLTRSRNSYIEKYI